MESSHKHPLRLEKYPGSLQDLAKEMGNLRYDKLAEFINFLAVDLREQALADSKRPSALNPQKKRVKLAASLEKSADFLDKSRQEITEAWKNAKRFM